MNADDEIKRIMQQQYIKDITDDMPGDIAMLQRIAKKFPNLKQQCEECEQLCKDIILESKEAYRKLSQPE